MFKLLIFTIMLILEIVNHNLTKIFPMHIFSCANLTNTLRFIIWTVDLQIPSCEHICIITLKYIFIGVSTKDKIFSFLLYGHYSIW